ncbi:putative nuclease HARBI1 isoform X1 [Ixodes scapularis]
MGCNVSAPSRRTMHCTPIIELFYSADKHTRSHRDAFELPEHVFRKRYRLGKTLVRWPCDELREEPGLRRLRPSSTAITVKDQVLCALRFRATGSFQGMVASDEHIARDQGTVSIALRAVVVAIVRRLGIQHDWIHFPQRASERDDLKRSFQLLGRIPGVIGCIDGTMISVVGPSKYDPTVTKAAYWYRKQYALNVMGQVCDAHCWVMCIDPCYPRSVHDSFAWRFCWLRDNFEQGRLIDDGWFLLVNRKLQAYCYAGRIENLPRGHRPRATTSEEDSQIVAASRRDPTLTAKEIRDELQLAASPYVVRRRLHEGSLHTRVPVRKPLLSAINKSKRLAFAEEHVSWTVDDWRMVLFSDESTFTTKRGQRQRIWRPDCTRFEALHMQRVASSGRCAVSVWGAMSKDGLGPLVRLDGRFTAEAYSGLIDTVLLPYALDGPFGDGFFYFQQDRSPVHMAAAVTRCLEDRGVMVPAQANPFRVSLCRDKSICALYTLELAGL